MSGTILFKAEIRGKHPIVTNIAAATRHYTSAENIRNGCTFYSSVGKIFM